MNESHKCALCGDDLESWQFIVKYDGDDCHINCVVEDQVGMDIDNDFGCSS